MKKKKHYRKIMAGILAFLLIFHTVYRDGNMIATAEEEESGTMDVYTFHVTEKQDIQDVDNPPEEIPIAGAVIIVERTANVTADNGNTSDAATDNGTVTADNGTVTPDDGCMSWELQTDAAGNAEFKIARGTDMSNYIYTVMKEDYETISAVSMKDISAEETIGVSMELKRNYTITGVVTETREDGSLKPIEGVTVTFGEEGQEVTARTNVDGAYSIDVTYTQGQTAMPYKAQKDGYAFVTGSISRGEEKADISMAVFGFMEPGIKEAAWTAGNIENPVVDSAGNAVSDIKYTIEKSKETDGTMGSTTVLNKYATIDEKTGTVIVKDLTQVQDVKLPAELTIQAVKAETNGVSYTASYTLKINKAEPEFTWETDLLEDESGNRYLYYGMTGISLAAAASNGSLVSYMVTEGAEFVTVKDGRIDSNIEESISSSKDELIGTVKIKAAVSEESTLYYASESEEYSFEVRRKQMDVENLALNGYKYDSEGTLQKVTENYKPNGQNGWFAGDSLILTMEGCKFNSDSTAFQSDDQWKDSFALAADETGIASASFYMKDASGAISGLVEVGDIQWDNVAPKVPTVTYATPIWEKILETITIGYYKADVEVTLSSNDNESGISCFTWGYTSTENGSVSDYKKVMAEEGKNEVTFKIDQEDSMKLDFFAYDKAGNRSEGYQETQKEIMLDKTAPEVSILYDNRNVTNEIYYNKERTAAITVTEKHFVTEKDQEVSTAKGGITASLIARDRNGNEIKDVNVIVGDKEVAVSQLQEELQNVQNWTTNGEEHTVKITYCEDASYEFRFQAEDVAGNSSVLREDKFWIDTTKPDLKDVTVSYSKPNNEKSEGAVQKKYYSGEMTVKLQAKDTSKFEERDMSSGIDASRLEWKYIDTSTGTESGKWTKFTNVTSFDDGSVAATIPVEEEGSRKIMVRAYDMAGNDVNFTDNSNEIIIDRTNPVLTVSYDNKEAQNKNYYDAQRTATISVTEENFDAEGIAVTVSAREVSGKDLPNTKVVLRGGKEVTIKQLPQELKNDKYWKWSDTDQNYQAKITFQNDANYSFSMNATDLAKRSSKNKITGKFCVDTTKPGGLTIDYSTPVLEKILEKVTFGYYKSHTVLTFTAKDATSGINSLTWKYEKAENASEQNVKSKEEEVKAEDIKYSSDGKTATFKVKLTAKKVEQYRGNISFSVVDKAGNKRTLRDEDNQVVIDNIAPTMSVTYEMPVNETKSKLYFNEEAVMKLKVTEANFYKKDVVIKVNGEKISVNNWKQETGTDNWNGSIRLSEDGDYQVTVSYKDRSDNKMKSYKSPILVVDTSKPVIKVTYDNNDVVYSEDGNDYFDRKRTATIQITDKNFRANEVETVITALKADGSLAAIRDYPGELKQSENWKKSGDTYTAEISYDVDANYTFDISYVDMAKNEAKDYRQDKFTVDTTAPVNLQISYSDSILETVLENVTFGFYNAKVTVTISAEDDVSGIHHFVYSYKNAENVSGVNSQEIEQRIEKDQITYSNGKKTATAQFTIPKSELDGNNQFNGIVEFDGADNSNYQTHTADARRIVVDNIAPAAEVTYNAPTSSANGIDYYAESVEGQITITEANFHAEDVQVSATKDGAPYALNVNWSDVNTDVHNGTFQFSEDGDYQVSISCQDKSGNTMAVYESNQLTVDSTTPTITVEEVANGTAYNQDVIGLKISVDDVNFDVAGFKPVLTAVVHEENGGFATKDYSELGKIETLESGKSYAYVIENIPEDAIYTLSCEAVDLSLNETSEMTVIDSGNNPMESITFSVNRNGSTFMLNDETQNLVEDYYVKAVEDNVVLQEINCDPVMQHKVTVNGNALRENQEYKVEDKRGENTWYQYDYVIEKDLFEEEGNYAVVVSTVDKAENVAYSDIKHVETSFVVDRTKPVVTVSGLAENGRYQVEAQKVNVIPADDGGSLSSLEISIYDREDQPVKNAVSLNGEELLKNMEENNGRIMFEIPQGVNQKISILCADAAGNVYEKIYKNITVSTEWYVMLLANKPLMYGGIAGIAAAAVLVTVGVTFRRRRKTK